MSSEKKLYLIDAMALMYQAFYAYKDRPLINSKGINTSAVYGFANILYKLLKEEKPTHIGVAFDTMAPTLRHEDFVEYKANRQEMPEDLSASIPYIYRLVEAFNIPTLFVEGYEADDVIGTLAKEAEKKDFKVFMVTPDKDFGQLVSENVLIYKPARFGDKPSIMGVKEVCEKFGIQKPEQLIDILGIWGDASDNIPGIPGIGEVGAKKLISEFGSLENILKNIDSISPEGMKQKVIAGQELAIQSKALATIILNVPIAFEEHKLILEHPHEQELKELLEELEMRTFAKRVFTDISLQKKETSELIKKQQPDLFGEISATTKQENISETSLNNIQNTPHEYILVDTKEKRETLIKILETANEFCFDTETTGLDPNSSELLGISFCMEPHKAYYVMLSKEYHETYEQVQEFKAIFENPNSLKIGQNIKFDMEMLKWYDIDVKGPMFDTMMAHYLIEPDLRHNMDYLAQSYLNYSPVPIEQLIGKKGKNQLSMALVPAEEIKEYASEDADITYQLKTVLEPELKKVGAEKLFKEIEIPLIPVLASMETEGVKLDKKALNDYSAELLVEIQLLEKEIFELAGVEFNIASPKQLGDVIYGHMKIIENPKKTATKQFSTAEDVLTKLVNKHPIIQKILDYRSLTKLKSTYVDALPELISPRTGRIHTSYNQAIAATGRLSSNNPNLQNIPVRTEKGREIRKAFVPRNEDYILVSADYSQIELRIIAAISDEHNMIEDFIQGHDIHAATASKVYNVALADVTKEQRRNAKMVNFGIIYGISAFGLSERLNIPRKEGAEIIEQYFKKYPAIKKYMEDTIASARKKGYVETISGRRRYLRDINSANAVVRGYAERNAINAPIQGSAADIIKIAMIKIFRDISANSFRSRMIMQVHDELVFDVYKPEKEAVLEIIKEQMKNAYELSVPLEIEMSSGMNWLEAH
ncbi:MAG: DNA polymerase I [Bacteroidales bacterium]|jgi:DNA polymerase-1|nr:DNA polymerase I [Bacteroidales bacterium]MDD4213438.1 DNA polymerase I [Bacteroidales bacterium]